MQDLYSFFCGGDDERSRNKPVYRDGTFWTMLGTIIAAALLSSLVAGKSRLMRWDRSIARELRHDLFFIPVPEWVVPIFALGVYVTYFLATYLMFRRINQSSDISTDRRNKAKSYMWLLFLVVLVSHFLWSWAYLGEGEPMLGLVFLMAMIAAFIVQVVMCAQSSWGGAMKGSWWLFIGMFLYFFLALPLNFSSVFLSNGKMEHLNKTIRKDRPNAFTNELSRFAL